MRTGIQHMVWRLLSGAMPEMRCPAVLHVDMLCSLHDVRTRNAVNVLT